MFLSELIYSSQKIRNSSSSLRKLSKKKTRTRLKQLTCKLFLHLFLLPTENTTAAIHRYNGRMYPFSEYKSISTRFRNKLNPPSLELKNSKRRNNVHYCPCFLSMKPTNYNTCGTTINNLQIRSTPLNYKHQHPHLYHSQSLFYTNIQFPTHTTSPLPPATTTTTTTLSMALLPIPRDTLSNLLTTSSSLPTAAQYATYWGRTSREQYNAFFEAFGVGFLGVFAAYFASFVIGTFIATILGMIAGFWVLLGPELKAYQRNYQLTGGRELVDPWYDDDDDDEFLDEDKRGLYGAYYLGRIDKVCVVESPRSSAMEEYSLDEFEGYTMEKDEMEKLTGIPYKLRLCVTDDDDDGRELQIHARMSEEYLDLEPGMPVCAVLLSTSQSFETLAGLTDFCVPDVPCWVGDYPYLDRAALEQAFEDDDELWNALREEGRGYWDISEISKS